MRSHKSGKSARARAVPVQSRMHAYFHLKTFTGGYEAGKIASGSVEEQGHTNRVRTYPQTVCVKNHAGMWRILKIKQKTGVITVFYDNIFLFTV